MSTLITRVNGDKVIMRSDQTAVVHAPNATYTVGATTYGGLLFAVTGWLPWEIQAPIDPTIGDLVCEHPGVFADSGVATLLCGTCLNWVMVSDL